MAYVKNGTLGAGTVWVLITEAAVTIDTTATVWHKVSDRGFINVMDYGAVGDGVTNDAAAIQAAIAACPSGGMVWFPVPAAYYSVASTILLKAYVKFAGPIGLSQLPAIDYGGEVGPGGAMIRQANGANLDAVLASPGWYSNVSISPMDPGIQIENLGVDGNYLNQSSGMGYGIATCGWRNEVNHCWVINTRSHGIYHSDATKNGTATGHAANGFRAANNIFDVNQGDAFHSNSVSGLVTDGWFLNNEIQNPAGNGAYFGCIAGWTIDGNHPYGVGLDNIVGVGSNAAVISDNYLEFPGAAVTSGGSAHHLNLTVTGGGNSLVIHGNHMRLDSAPTAGVTYYGVYLAVTSGTLPVELAANGVDGYATGAYGTAYEINVSSGATVNVASAANKASSVATIWSAPGVGTVNTTNDDIMTAVVAAQVGTAGQGTSFAPPFLATSASAVLTSNHVYAAQIVVPPGPAAPITGICIGNGATATGNATMALFNSAGNQVAVSASTTITGTYTTQFIPFTGVYDAMPGVYSVAVIFSGSAAVFQVCSGGPSSIQAQGSYAMPSSITALSSAPRYVPGMSTY